MATNTDRLAKMAEETFGADARCLAVLLHLAMLTKGFKDGPFKAGFEQAIEEAGAFLDSMHADGGDQVQTLMEQMLGLVNGNYILSEMPNRPLGIVQS